MIVVGGRLSRATRVIAASERRRDHDDVEGWATRSNNLVTPTEVGAQIGINAKNEVEHSGCTRDRVVARVIVLRFAWVPACHALRA